MTTKKEKGTIVGVVLSLLLLLVFMFCQSLYVYGTADVELITVTRTERVTMGSGDSQRSVYLVFTDGETFRNSDTIWHLKFNSSDLHGRIKAGTTYSVKVYGWRVPAMSWYRNIIEIKEHE